MLEKNICWLWQSTQGGWYLIYCPPPLGAHFLKAPLSFPVSGSPSWWFLLLPQRQHFLNNQIREGCLESSQRMWSWKGRSWCFLSTFHHLLWTPKYSLSSSLHFKHCSIYSGRKQMIWLLLCYSFDPWVTFNLSVWSVFLSLSLIVLSVWSNLLLPGCYLFDPGARSQVTPTAWHCLTGTEQRPESLSVPCVSSAIIWPTRICWDTPITEYQDLIE